MFLVFSFWNTTALTRIGLCMISVNVVLLWPQSCIIKRYCEKRFVSKYLATIGIDFGVTR